MLMVAGTSAGYGLRPSRASSVTASARYQVELNQHAGHRASHQRLAGPEDLEPLGRTPATQVLAPALPLVGLRRR